MSGVVDIHLGHVRFGPVEESAFVVPFTAENTRQLCFGGILKMDDVSFPNTESFHEIPFDVFRIVIGRGYIGNVFTQFFVIGIGNDDGNVIWTFGDLLNNFLGFRFLEEGGGKILMIGTEIDYSGIINPWAAYGELNFFHNFF